MDCAALYWFDNRANAWRRFWSWGVAATIPGKSAATPYTLRDAKHWIQIANPETPITNFAIVVADAAVGGIGLILKDDVFRRSAEIGYWLGEEYWGRGIVTEAVRAVTDSPI